MAKRFNVRVYGIWIHEGMLLVNEEQIRGTTIVKLPGGGLEWGEGPKDCLRREWMEELGLEVSVLDHFYTTDFFQHSAYDDSQVISIYYEVTADGAQNIVNRVSGERTFWLSLDAVGPRTFTLPIDKVVGGMLQQRYAR